MVLQAGGGGRLWRLPPVCAAHAHASPLPSTATPLPSPCLFCRCGRSSTCSSLLARSGGTWLLCGRSQAPRATGTGASMAGPAACPLAFLWPWVASVILPPGTHPQPYFSVPALPLYPPQPSHMQPHPPDLPALSSQRQGHLCRAAAGGARPEHAAPAGKLAAAAEVGQPWPPAAGRAAARHALAAAGCGGHCSACLLCGAAAPLGACAAAAQPLCWRGGAGGGPCRGAGGRGAGRRGRRGGARGRRSRWASSTQQGPPQPGGHTAGPRAAAALRAGRQPRACSTTHVARGSRAGSAPCCPRRGGGGGDEGTGRCCSSPHGPAACASSLSPGAHGARALPACGG